MGDEFELIRNTRDPVSHEPTFFEHWTNFHEFQRKQSMLDTSFLPLFESLFKVKFCTCSVDEICWSNRSSVFNF